MESAARAGNLLGLEGFDFAKADEVRAEALGGAPSSSASSRRAHRRPLAARPAAESPPGLERVADIPLYFADPWFAARRRCKDQGCGAPLARMNAATMAAAGVADGQAVRVRSVSGVVSLTARLDGRSPTDACGRRCPREHRRPRPLSGMISVEGL